jgi:hypothetical protein
MSTLTILPSGTTIEVAAGTSVTVELLGALSG